MSSEISVEDKDKLSDRVSATAAAKAQRDQAIKLPYNLKNVRGTGELPDDGPIQSPVYEVLTVDARFWATVIRIALKENTKNIGSTPTQQAFQSNNNNTNTHHRSTISPTNHHRTTSLRRSISPSPSGTGDSSSGQYRVVVGRSSSSSPQATPAAVSGHNGGDVVTSPLTVNNLDVLNREEQKNVQEYHQDFLQYAVGTGTLSDAALSVVLCEQGVPCSEQLSAALIRRIAGGRQRLNEKQFVLLMTAVNSAVVRTIAASNLKALGRKSSPLKGRTPTEAAMASVQQLQQQQQPSRKPPRGESPPAGPAQESERAATTTTPSRSGTPGRASQRGGTPTPSLRRSTTPGRVSVRSGSPTASSFSPSYRSSTALSNRRMETAVRQTRPFRSRLQKNYEKPWLKPALSDETALTGGYRRSTTPVKTVDYVFSASTASGKTVNSSGGVGGVVRSGGDRTNNPSAATPPPRSIDAHEGLARHHQRNIEMRKAAGTMNNRNNAASGQSKRALLEAQHRRTAAGRLAGSASTTAAGGGAADEQPTVGSHHHQVSPVAVSSDPPASTNIEESIA